jgi:hypothetical protein
MKVWVISGTSEQTSGAIRSRRSSIWSVSGPRQRSGAALEERYTGLIDRVVLYIPFVPGERDSFWRTVVESV